MDDEIKSLHVSIHEGKWMPPDVRERMLTRVQARAFVRGYLQLIDIQRDEEDDPLERIRLDRFRAKMVSNLHRLS